MNTLIIPCAGRSNRFPNMKPKWMLTHPDGSLMIEKSLSGLNLEIFDRIIITIVKPHDEEYEAKLVLSQVFKNAKVEVCLLDDFTKSASETVFSTLEKMKVRGSFIAKDSDNYVSIDIPRNIDNFIVGCDLHKNPHIANIPGKSFIVANSQGIIQDIIEKHVISNIICVGVYAFEDAELFKNGYLELMSKNLPGEMFISHVISYLLSTKKHIFTAKEANGYADWGTIKEWSEIQKDFRTYFVDVDGILLKNCGKYGSINWYNNEETIPENIDVIKNLQAKGGQIVITTSRGEEFRVALENLLSRYGITPYAILMGLHHSSRMLINDFAPTNPYPSATAISLPRNNHIKEYLL